MHLVRSQCQWSISVCYKSMCVRAQQREEGGGRGGGREREHVHNVVCVFVCVHVCVCSMIHNNSVHVVYLTTRR